MNICFHPHAYTSCCYSPVSTLYPHAPPSVPESGRAWVKFRARNKNSGVRDERPCVPAAHAAAHARHPRLHNEYTKHHATQITRDRILRARESRPPNRRDSTRSVASRPRRGLSLQARARWSSMRLMLLSDLARESRRTAAWRIVFGPPVSCQPVRAARRRPSQPPSCPSRRMEAHHMAARLARAHHQSESGGA